MDIAKLAIVMTANAGGVGVGLKKGEQYFLAFERSIDTIGSSIISKVSFIGAGIAAALGGIGIKEAITRAMDTEDSLTSMTTLLRSGEDAGKMLKQLKRFAADTPFEFPELRNAATTLIGMRVEASQVLPILKLLGEVAAGLGPALEGGLQELANVFGRNYGSGRLYTKDINEFRTRGIPIIEALGKVFGKTNEQIMKMVEDGKIGSAEMVAAFQQMAGAGGQFADVMKNKSQTLRGVFSTFRDEVGFVLEEIGTMLVQELDLKDIITDAVGWLQKYGKGIAAVFRGGLHWIKENATAIKIVAGVVGALVAITLTAVAVQKAWNAAQIITLALSGPKGWAILGVAAVVATTAIAGASAMMSNFADDAKKAAAANTEAAEAIGEVDTKAMLAKSNLEKVTGEISAMREELTKQINTFGMSGTEIKMWELAQMGATDEMIRSVTVLQDQLSALEANKKMMEDLQKQADKWLDKLKTPFEKINEELAEVEKAFKKGIIDEAQFDAITNMLNTEWSKEWASKNKQEKKKEEKFEPKFGEAIERRFTKGFAQADARAVSAQLRTAKATEETAKNTRKTGKDANPPKTANIFDL